jgi:putative addiction module component (TIGR02574 family)
MPTFEEVRATAERLPPNERLRLIRRLWQSMPAEYWPQQSDVERADVSRRLAKLNVERTDYVPWPIVERLMADCARSSGNQVYAVPRRFDLSTIFVVTIAFSLLFAGMRLLPFPPVASAIVGGYFALIGLGQAFLFRGNRPRTASMLVGALYYALLHFIFWQMSGPRAHPISSVVISSVFVLIFGAVLGFVAGTLVGSVFMFADLLRRALPRKIGEEGNTSQDNDGQQRSDFSNPRVPPEFDVSVPQQTAGSIESRAK